MDDKAKELFALINRTGDKEKMFRDVKAIIEKNSFLKGSRDRTYATILHRACEVHNLKLIDLLVQSSTIVCYKLIRQTEKSSFDPIFNQDEKLARAEDTTGKNCIHYYLKGFKDNPEIPKEEFDWLENQCKRNDKLHYQLFQSDNLGMTPLMLMCSIYKASEKMKIQKESDGEEENTDEDEDDSDEEGTGKATYTHNEVLDFFARIYQEEKEKYNIFAVNAHGQTVVGVASERDGALVALIKALLDNKFEEQLMKIRDDRVPRAEKKEIVASEQSESRGACASTCILL